MWRVLGFNIILQQGQLDEYVLDTILGIGALAWARNSTQARVPLVHHRLSGALRNHHYQRALHHYNNAIQKLKPAVLSAQPEAQLQIMYTSCVLFLMFEILQENVEAVDQLGRIGMKCLSRLSPAATTSYIRSASSVTRFMTSNNVVYVSLSPQAPGIRASIFTDTATIFKPPAVVGPESSTQEFITVWWRLLTTVINLCVHPAAGDFSRLGSETVSEIRTLLTLIGSWEEETRKRLATAQGSGPVKLFQLVATITSRFALIAQPGELADETSGTGYTGPFSSDALDCVAILELFKLCRKQPASVDGMPCAEDKFDITNEVAHSPALPAILHIARYCPSNATRLDALALFRSMLHPNSSSNLKSLYMVLRALADIERWEPTIYYDWAKGSWNDTYSALNATLTPMRYKGKQRPPPRELVLRVEDYGL